MSGTVWLITGSARGLGRDIAVAALEAGDRVAATARDPRRLDDLVARYGDALTPIALDVTDAAAARRAVAETVAAFGRLDVVVNNAGYATLASIEDTSDEAFRDQVETNLFGVVNVTRAALPVLREQGSGHIVTVSSVGARTASPGLGAYQMSKWAVSGFSEVLAREVGPLGIKVTAVEPGGMRTEWAGASMAVPPVSAPYEQTVGQVAKHFTAGNDDSAGDPAKVAQAILAVVAMDAPPARLLLGSDALTVATASAAAQSASDTAFAELTRSTDHEDFDAAELARISALTGAGKSPVEVVTRFLDEVVNGGDAALIDELWAPDMEWHGGSLGEFSSREEWKALSAGAAMAFAEMHLTVRDIVADGEKVAVRFTNGGRHVGPFLGAEATGKRAEWLGIGIYTVRGGQIVEAWFGEDMLGLLQQVGAVTLPGA